MVTTWLPAHDGGVRPGPANGVCDVAGFQVGHVTRQEPGWLTGTTVVLSPSDGAVGGVDVRGGAPGTRETPLLDPLALVERVHAVVLTGGSAFGLAAADGAMAQLEAAGRGLRVGGTDVIVPLVPAAVLFDLGRGGSPAGGRPGAGDGALAVTRALDGCDAAQYGAVGAGTGAVAGGLKGGLGGASAVLPGGPTVAALVAVNSVGSTVDPRTGELYAVRLGLDGEFDQLLGPPSPQDVRRAAAAGWVGHKLASAVGTATTIGVICTDATLTKAQCAKVASVGHDGLARAIRPVHTMFDGDTLFTLATGRRPPLDQLGVHTLLSVAADCVSRAVGHAMLTATSVRTSSGSWLSYRDAFPSAFGVP